MAVVVRHRKRGAVYFVCFTWRGKRVWERAGTDRRQADSLHTQRRREVKAGTYNPNALSKSTTVAQFGKEWADKRLGRNALDEARILDRHVWSHAWFASTPLVDVKPGVIERFVDEVETTVSEKTREKISDKYVANIYGLLSTMFRRAVKLELIPSNPCQLERDRLSREPMKERVVYEPAAIRALVAGEKVHPASRVWNALAFFTGMRRGEVCGRRFKDYNPDAAPLGALRIWSQYNDQPLKTDKKGKRRPRVAPVHPVLAEILKWWWTEGFEFVFLRKPTPDDFIVPTQGGHLANHTESTAYKMWIRACEAAGVKNLTVHSTRHTFISIVRSRGADKATSEKVTHNAKGDQVERYTHLEWQALCRVVMAFSIDEAGPFGGGWAGGGHPADVVTGVDTIATALLTEASGVSSIPGASTGSSWPAADCSSDLATPNPLESCGIVGVDAGSDAGQRSEASPEEGGPGHDEIASAEGSPAPLTTEVRRALRRSYEAPKRKDRPVSPGLVASRIEVDGETVARADARPGDTVRTFVHRLARGQAPLSPVDLARRGEGLLITARRGGSS